MEEKNMFGYEHEEKAIDWIKRTHPHAHGTSSNMSVLALAHAELASLEIQRKIASVLVDIEVAIRELTKTIKKNGEDE